MTLYSIHCAGVVPETETSNDTVRTIWPALPVTSILYFPGGSCGDAAIFNCAALLEVTRLAPRVALSPSLNTVVVSLIGEEKPPIRFTVTGMVTADPAFKVANAGGANVNSLSVFAR
jgi:hypothetical protein